MAAAVEAYLNDNTDCPGVITAQTLHDNLDDYTVVDIRSADAYMAGHIPGAYKSVARDHPDGRGHDDPRPTRPSSSPATAARAPATPRSRWNSWATRTSRPSAFGMSSWHSSLAGGWNSNIGDNLAAPETTNNNGELTVHDFPTLTGTNATIVATRVAAMLAAGFQSITWATLQPNLDDYFVVNYFGEADYLGTGTAGVPGHIPGAYQFTPYASLGFEQMLDNLPSDGTPIVVYCWTGQHSSQVVAALNMLGYNAKSLSYGSNHLFHCSPDGQPLDGGRDPRLRARGRRRADARVRGHVRGRRRLHERQHGLPGRDHGPGSLRQPRRLHGHRHPLGDRLRPSATSRRLQLEPGHAAERPGRRRSPTTSPTWSPATPARAPATPRSRWS